MNQTEHLELINAHLHKLLAVAEKRSPGEWLLWTTNGDTRYTAGDWHHVGSAATQRPDDAAFIASSPGNAEAGWRATIAMIERVQLLDELPGEFDPIEYHIGYQYSSDARQEMLDIICAAWPIELLNA